MNAVLTDNMSLMAGAPNGIKKLRELILELAVRGKLVPQDPGDGPASELLKRIAEEKARLVAKGKIKKQKPQPEITDEEKPFQLPTGWEWVRLDSLLKKIGAGSTPLGGKQAYVANGVKFLRSQNVWSEGLRLNEVAFIPEETHQKMSGTHVEAGDLLFNITGASIGRCAAVPADFDTGNVSQHVTIIRPVSGAIQPFLHTALISQLVQQTVMDVQVGVSREGLSIGKLAQFLIPFPPEVEQHRIVAKVDELMALCDRLEARQADADSAHVQLVQALLGSLTQASDAEDFAQSWQRLAEHFHTLFTTESSIDALKQTLLQLAVMGKLVPQNPSDEPASELLKRIAEEKARLVTEGKLRKPKARLEISEEEMAFNLPRGWQWVRKADVFNFLNGYAFKSEWFQHKGIRLLRNINVAHGEVDWEESACITEEQAADYEAFSLEEDDVVLTLDRPIISTGLKYAVVRRNDLPCLLLQRVAKISPYAASVTVGYLTTWLKSSFFVGAIDPGRSNGVPHISTTQVASMLFALPPLAEQHRIVAKVDQLMALCDQLKARLNQARQVHEHLASALVEQAVA
ncbi:restriction endonuclease subunit S [Pseudomonas sp. BIGb0427]|uniref:restriction endonuclease subunit S n=1 Tax=Pseudomonas sp. BIGb0427 TaxID=2724470 RepID=UPI0018A7BEA8|nr:restriction endonuclease subunit S [Pseudomonas sp. BIGb0427]QPG62685.1 restriction endonuclease subunit S [Pseudomonas sp. BIGb0427]